MLTERSRNVAHVVLGISGDELNLSTVETRIPPAPCCRALFRIFHPLARATGPNNRYSTPSPRLMHLEQSDDIANMTGRLPQMVRTTVDVGLLRGWRGEPSVGRDLDRQGEGHVMVGALQGWKAAVDALDQSQRYGVCGVGMSVSATLPFVL